jgi:hypothetical protein
MMFETSLKPSLLSSLPNAAVGLLGFILRLLLRPSSLSSLEHKKSDHGDDDENAFPLTVFPSSLLLFRKATVSLPLTRPLLLPLLLPTKSLVVVV